MLEANAGDNCVEVFVSVVENPGQFWVQNIGSMSVELDKNDLCTGGRHMMYEESEDKSISEVFELKHDFLN